MRDGNKTRAQLIEELADLRQRIAELDAAETERVRSEEEWAEETSWDSNEKLRAILDASPDAVHLLDINGIILSTNAGFARRMGIEIDDAVGTCVYDCSENRLCTRNRDHADRGRPRAVACDPSSLKAGLL